VRHRPSEFGQEVGLFDDGVAMVRAYEAGALGRQPALIKQRTMPGEPDREGRGRMTRARGHGGDNGGRIDSARKEGSVRDVGHNLALDGVGEALGEQVGQGVV
jgi:hypothetical protein